MHVIHIVHTGRLPRLPAPAAAHTFAHTSRSTPPRYEKILKAPLVFTPDHLFSPAARDLITGMLQKDPAVRLGSSEKDGFEIREHKVRQPRSAVIDTQETVQRQSRGERGPTLIWFSPASRTRNA